MTKSSSLLRTAVFGIFIAAAFGQFGFGGSPFQGQGGGGFRGPVGGGGFRGPINAVQGGGFRGPVGGGGFRGPINAVQGGGFRGPAAGGNPLAGLFPQAQQAPDPPMPKGRQIKTKSKGELIDYLVGVIVNNHERIAHITHHNYSEILEEEENRPRHTPTRLDSIKQALKIHNLTP